MNRLCVLFAVCLTVSCSVPQEKYAYDVVKRTFGSVPANLEFRYEPCPDSISCYSLEVGDGVLRVSGSSAVALCKGFHDYIQDNGYGSVTWSGSRLELPEDLPAMEKITVESPYSVHLFYNVCTFGYSTAFWSWDEWEKELDWLALHGFDMPLAPVGTEGILWRVYEKMGLSAKEIQDYFSGPAHFPWMRMGNMCTLDGGMSRKWHERQIRLEHKILGRMEKLGMTPVFQGFAGFVPEAVETHFPEVTITRNDWHGLHNQLLSAKDSLFQVIGTDFIREWEREFGKGKYYLIDSFNEIDVPFGPKGTEQRYNTIRSYSEATYASLKAANPDAVWVMQGWMFGRDRLRIWDPESVKALLDGAPDDKLMIIDLAVDFNEFVWRNEKSWDYLDGFSNKKWIWSTTPNFGGRTSLKGTYDFYLNAHLDALQSPNRRRLSGFGSSPEGIETNEALYEAISSAGWSREAKDPGQFLAQYYASRYGCGPELMMPLVEGLLGSVYNHFTSSDNHKWMSRPCQIRPNVFNVNDGFFEAVEYLYSLSDGLSGSDLYRKDLIVLTSEYVASKADVLCRELDINLARKDFVQAAATKERLFLILRSLDALLEAHPLAGMQRWLDMADKCATCPEERAEFRKEALRIVTSWGASSINDYASRNWAGLIRDYYIPRIEAYASAVTDGTDYDLPSVQESLIERIAADGFSPAPAVQDPVAAVGDLLSMCRDIRMAVDDDIVGVWTPVVSSRDKEWKISVLLPKDMMVGLKGFIFEPTDGGSLEIVRMTAGNRSRVYYEDGPAGTITPSCNVYLYKGPETDGNVENMTHCSFQIGAVSSSGGIVRILK